MTRLDCSVTGCMYNADKCCHKGNIQIEGDGAKKAQDTCCGSFQECGGNCTKNVTGNNPKTIDVACNVKNCVYNQNQKCSAEHIGIAGGDACNCRETECASFRCE